jgi:transcriptional regulator with XRE-family HTH domain
MHQERRDRESKDWTLELQKLMAEVGIKSFRELSRRARTSERTINKLRSGEIGNMRWSTLLALSGALTISVDNLVNIFSDRGDRLTSDREPELERLQQEYDRLDRQLQQQRTTLESEFQHQSLQALESFLTYYPTAKQAAIDDPDFPATKLLPLLRSVEQLIAGWGVTAIGTVGAEISYDPQWHQLIDGTAEPGDLVKVRYVGYQQGEKLLFRAKVSI